MRKVVQIMRKVVQNIADGDLGIDQTVQNMWRLINRDVPNALVVKKANELKGETQEETARNIFNYVWKKHPYKSDPPDAEQLTAPVHMLNGNNRKEDCDGLVMLLCALLLAAKIDCRIKVIAWRRQEFTHVVAEAKINGRWMTLDPTFKSNGWDNTYKPIRTKIYGNPMGTLITLEDKPSCIPCGKRGAISRMPVNQNIINIGNEFAENSKNRTDFRNSENGYGGTIMPQKIREIVEKPVTQKITKKEFIPQKQEVVKYLPSRAHSKPNVVWYGEWY